MHRNDSAVEAHALAISLWAIQRHPSFIDAESDAELFEQSGLKLRPFNGVDLLRHAVAHDPIGVHCVRDGDGALVMNRDGLGQAGYDIKYP